MVEHTAGKTVPARWRAVLLAAVSACALSGCLAMAGTPAAREPRMSQDAGAPDAARQPHPEFWVNPENPAAQQIEEWRRMGRTTEAALLERIAEQPLAEWLGESPRQRARRITESAERAERMPVMVAYHIPYRDCGSHSAGGSSGGAEYRSWIREVAAGIGNRKAVVILEPDAVAQVVDGCVPGRLREGRLALLHDAVSVLAALPATRVYLDAGHSGWIKDPERLVGPLRRSGIGRADGFALNVSNFQPTKETVEYGRRLSAGLGGARFVIDTSRNGNGPRTAVQGEASWCNPPGRRLGERPSTRTGDPMVDAYLWVKRPGESDGTCNGGPPAGQWWARYALALAAEEAAAAQETGGSS